MLLLCMEIALLVHLDTQFQEIKLNVTLQELFVQME